MASPGLEIFVDDRPHTDRDLIDGGAALLPTEDQIKRLKEKREDGEAPYTRYSHDNELLEGGAMLNFTAEQVEAARNEMNKELVTKLTDDKERIVQTTQRLAHILDSHWKGSGIPADERTRQLKELGVILPRDEAATDTTEQQIREQGEPAVKPEPLKVGDGIRLLTHEEFEQLPDGVIVYGYFGGKPYTKGVDYIDQDTRGGKIAFGVAEPSSDEHVLGLFD